MTYFIFQNTWIA
jgi:hypothetical protein